MIISILLGPGHDHNRQKCVSILCLTSGGRGMGTVLLWKAGLHSSDIVSFTLLKDFLVE